MAISRVVSEMFNVETYRDLGRRSLMVIGTDTYRPMTSLLTFHGPISNRFRDRRRFQSNIAKFSHPRVFYSPADGVTPGIEYRRKRSKTRMIGLPDGGKTLKNGLAA